MDGAFFYAKRMSCRCLQSWSVLLLRYGYCHSARDLLKDYSGSDSGSCLYLRCVIHWEKCHQMPATLLSVTALLWFTYSLFSDDWGNKATGLRIHSDASVQLNGIWNGDDWKVDRLPIVTMPCLKYLWRYFGICTDSSVRNGRDPSPDCSRVFPGEHFLLSP